MTIAWRANPGNERATAEPLDLAGGRVIRFKVPKRDFDRIADRRDFRLGSNTPHEIVGAERWEEIAQRLVD